MGNPEPLVTSKMRIAEGDAWLLTATPCRSTTHPSDEARPVAVRDVMHTSDTRMLTTHVGSLPRSPRLTELLLRQERSEVVDEAELARQVETAVETVVRKQFEVGIDI